MNKSSKTTVKDVVSPRQRSMFVGQKVLAQWLDGLHYLGNISKLNVATAACLIKFEDQSKFPVMYKHITQASNRDEISCSVCHDDTSCAPDEIVLCDNCSRGYHQSCHIPCINKSVLKPGVRWLCRLCVFSSTVKNGGVRKTTKAFQSMKMTLPYTLKCLTWDKHHTVNRENSYCYCGGPGLWFQKMLSCCRCEQWFHEACLECLPRPLHYADDFYIFVCALCNGGAEFLSRLPVKWVDVAHIALFNLQVLTKTKTHDVEQHIVPWITKHRNSFLLDSLETQPSNKSGLVNLLKREMFSQKTLFCNGQEKRRRFTLFSLRQTWVPRVPPFSVPSHGPVSMETLQKLERLDCRVVTPIRTIDPVDMGLIYVLRHRLVNGQTQPSNRAQTKRNNGQVKKLNGQQKMKPQSESDVNTSTDRSPQSVANERIKKPRKTLDEKIPQILSFQGSHNPFYTKLELREMKRKRRLERKRKRRLLEALESERALIDSPAPSSDASLAGGNTSRGDPRWDLDEILAFVKHQREKESLGFEAAEKESLSEGGVRFDGSPAGIVEGVLSDAEARLPKSPCVMSANFIRDAIVRGFNVDEHVKNLNEYKAAGFHATSGRCEEMEGETLIDPPLFHPSDTDIPLLLSPPPSVTTGDESFPPPLIEPPSPPLSPSQHEHPPKLAKEVTRRSTRKRGLEDQSNPDATGLPAKVAKFNGEEEFKNFIFTRPNALPLAHKGALTEPLRVQTDLSPEYNPAQTPSSDCPRAYQKRKSYRKPRDYRSLHAHELQHCENRLVSLNVATTPQPLFTQGCFSQDASIPSQITHVVNDEGRCVDDSRRVHGTILGLRCFLNRSQCLLQTARQT